MSENKDSPWSFKYDIDVGNPANHAAKSFDYRAKKMDAPAPILFVLKEDRQSITPSITDHPRRRSTDAAPNVAGTEKENLVMSKTTDDIFDVKIALAEAQTDTKFAQLNGKIDLLLQAVQTSDRHQIERSAAMERQLSEFKTLSAEDVRHTRTTVRNTGYALAGLFVTLVGILVAVATLFPTVFGMGLQLRDIVKQEISATSAPASPAAKDPSS